jgi:hypothetical protein
MFVIAIICLPDFISVGQFDSPDCARSSNLQIVPSSSQVAKTAHNASLTKTRTESKNGQFALQQIPGYP